MEIEKGEDGTAWIRETVENLAGHYREGRRLYRVNSDFEWRAPDDSLELVALAQDFFGENELDFASEYLLLHGKDEIALPWEDDRPEATEF